MRRTTARLAADIRRGVGLASPELILVWLALGAGLIWLQWSLGQHGVEAHSGTVTSVNSDPKFGMHVTIDSTSMDFFFDSIDFPQFPDVRVGDHVDMLTIPVPEGNAVAVQSQRGTWIDTIFGDEVAPFTPATWPLHEAIRWAALLLGILSVLLGVTSLIRWIPSGQGEAAPVAETSASIAPTGIGSDEVAMAEAAPFQDQAARRVAAPSPAPSKSADPAGKAVWVGALTVTVLPLGEAVGIFVANADSHCGCESFWPLLMLLVVPIALAVGGVSTLILASLSPSGSPKRIPGRQLGVLALALAVAGVPINFFIALSWAMWA